MHSTLSCPRGTLERRESLACWLYAWVSDGEDNLQSQMLYILMMVVGYLLGVVLLLSALLLGVLLLRVSRGMKSYESFSKDLSDVRLAVKEVEVEQLSQSEMLQSFIKRDNSRKVRERGAQVQVEAESSSTGGNSSIVSDTNIRHLFPSLSDILPPHV